jgi:hypothetical protein
MVLRLYRDVAELRRVHYPKPSVARAVCHSLGEGCDYPVLFGKLFFSSGTRKNNDACG